MIDEPFFKDFGPAFPVDVAAAAGEETGDGVAAEVVDPAFLPELAHYGVDPGEAGAAEFPSLEPGFCLLRVDGVGACDKVCFRVDSGGEVPGDEARSGVVVGLGKGVAEGGLGGEVHVAKEELADEIGGDLGGFAFIFFL